MKNTFKGKLILIVTLMLVVIILTSAFTLSWFSSNATAVAENATLVTAHDTEAGVSIISMSDSEYSGETGKGIAGSKDEPYVSTAQINLKIVISQGTPILTIDFERLIIVRGGGQIDNLSDQLINTTDVFASFTLRARLEGSSTLYKINEAGQMVQEDDEEIFMPLVSGDNIIYLSIIFLGENRYLQWQEDNITAAEMYDFLQPDLPIEEWVRIYTNQLGQIEFFNYAAFEYCEPRYMFCNYFISIKYIIDEITG